MRWILATAIAIVLVACGGSSGGGVAASTTFTPPPLTTSLSEPITQLNVSAYANNLAPFPSAVTVTVSNPPSGALTYRVSTSGKAVSSATFAWRSATSGTLTVQFPSPTTLGAGSYQGTVQLSVCSDTACHQSISGSPVSLAVTYIVWIGSQPQTSFTLQQGPKAITSPLYTSQTDQIEDDFSLYISNPPTSGLWVMVTQPSSGFVVGASLEPYTGPDAVVGLMLKSPAQLGSGFFNGSVAFEVCYDPQCQNPVQGSPVIEPLTFLVSLTSGHEFDLKTVGIPGITDVAWNVANQQLYATTVATYGSPASLVAVDPVAGTVGASLSFGPDLYQVALSDDGQYGYVASRDQPIVYRIQFPAFVSDLQIPLGSPLVGASPFANSVFQMQVAPGSPQTLAVSFARAGSTDYTSGVAVFDGATERANLLPKLEDFGTPADIAWGASPSILYAVRDTEQLPADLRELDIVSADTNGLSVGTTFPISLADPLRDIWYAGGRLYGTDGNVRDPSTNTILAQYVVPSGYQLSTLMPDPANGRLFILVHGTEDSRLLLLCYDASTLALRSVTDLGFDETIPYPLHLITWGTDGIAFTSGESSLAVFSGSFLSSASSGPSEIKKSATLRLR